jgi:hypothetical protein
MTIDILTGPAPRPVSLSPQLKANRTVWWLAVVAGFPGWHS